MQIYTITNTHSGHTLGSYRAATEAEALDMMARDAGCRDYAHACEIAAAQPGELLIEEVDKDFLIERAAEYLGATDVGQGWAYLPAEHCDHVYVVDEHDVADLGGRLLIGQADAYSLWCAETDAESSSAAELIRACPEWRTDSSLDDLEGLRQAAGAAGDYLTIAVIDHLADELRALRSEPVTEDAE
jgi:hypothetical protein